MTPSLIFDLDILINNILRFQKLSKFYFCNKNVFLYYAIKANHSPQILNVVLDNNLGIEILSKTELDKVPSAIPIQVNGHYKSDELLTECMKRNKCMINVEDISELYRIDHLLNSNIIVNGNIQIGLRLKVTEQSRIGIAYEQLPEVIEFAKQHSWVNLEGLHYHVGWNVKDDDAIKLIVQRMMKSHELLKQNGIYINSWNFGGSFAEHITYPFQLKQRLQILSANLPEEVQNIYFEPGRYLVGDAGYLISTIVEKRSEQVIINSSTYGYMLTAGSPYIVLCKNRYNTMHLINIDNEKGKTCISGVWPSENDCFYVDCSFDDLDINDKIIFYNMGAYTEDIFNNLVHDGILTYKFIGLLPDLIKYLSYSEKQLFVKYWDFNSKQIRRPKKENDLMVILKALKGLFKVDVMYTESEVNIILAQYNADYCLLRRKLVDFKFLYRENEEGVITYVKKS